MTSGQLLERRARELPQQLREASSRGGFYGEPGQILLRRAANTIEQLAALTPLPGDDLELVRDLIAHAYSTGYRDAEEDASNYGGSSRECEAEGLAQFLADNDAAITSFRVIGGEREGGLGDPPGNPLSPSGSSPQAVSPASPHQSGAGSE